MKDAPAFDFFPADWLSGTLTMTFEEKGLYVDLLAMQWEAGHLPSDVHLKRLRAKPKILTVVLEKFPVGEDGLRRNLRLESERMKQRKRREAKSLGAQKTNAKRWSKTQEPEGSGQDRQTSLSDQSATEADIAKRQFSESPPITHHPSPANNTNRESLGSFTPVLPMEARAPSLEVVKGWAERVMAPVECAEVFWNEAESRGLTPDGYWQDKSGNEIRNPGAAFRAFATKWKANDSQRKNHGQPHRKTSVRSDSLNPAGRYS